MDQLRDFASQMRRELAAEPEPTPEPQPQPRALPPPYTPPGGTKCLVCQKPIGKGGCLRCKACGAALCHDTQCKYLHAALHQQALRRSSPEHVDPCQGSASDQAVPEPSKTAQTASAASNTNASTTTNADAKSEPACLAPPSSSSANTAAAPAPAATENASADAAGRVAELVAAAEMLLSDYDNEPALAMHHRGSSFERVRSALGELRRSSHA